ncbi:MAG: LysM peptidoglycan-binding domain-containing protein [Gammaproteobacteria bacterium]
MQGYRSIISGSLAVLATVAVAGCASHPPATPAPAPASTPPAATAPAPAPTPSTAPLPVKQTAPVRYVVKPGDTLWSISTQFFSSPWLWPEVWYENHYIQNPHLIYPGDIITLNGGALTISRNGTVVRSTSPFRQLQPQIQHTSLAQAIPTIPYDEISDLLSKPRVMTADQYKQAPYILSTVDGQLLAAAPNSVYVRGKKLQNAGPGDTYAVVNKEKALHDPHTHELLGYEVLYLGRGKLIAGGDPSTLKLTASTQEIHPGNRLVPVDTGAVPAQFPLLTPKTQINGQIIDVVGGLHRVGQYQVVVLDRGSKNQLETGDVLNVERPGTRVHDPYAQSGMSSHVKLPGEQVGEVVVFRVFPRVAFALVMHATRPLGIGDTVTNP